eukprot:5754476-Amphidinium_carterae.1
MVYPSCLLKRSCASYLLTRGEIESCGKSTRAPDVCHIERVYQSLSFLRCANVGDSRAIICRGGKVLNMLCKNIALTKRGDDCWLSSHSRSAHGSEPASQGSLSRRFANLHDIQELVYSAIGILKMLSFVLPKYVFKVKVNRPKIGH